MSARHEQRIKRYQSEQAARAAAQQQQQAGGAGPPPLSPAPRRHTVPAPGTSTSSAAQQGGSAPLPSPSGGAATTVSLITALFPNAGATVRTRQDQVESDFMFALFIQEQENVSGSEKVGKVGGGKEIMCT